MKKTTENLVLLLVIIFVSCTSFEVPQLFNTTLQITVRDELGNVVEGAEVLLYKTEEDYEKNINPVMEAQHTNNKGIATFSKIEPIEYFVNVSKDDASNIGAGVKTGNIDAKRLNKVTIIIE